MEKINKQRIVFWDNIKGALILLTVFAHILYGLQEYYPTINSIVDYIYMFHMPAFVFVSGYFGKSEHSHSFESIFRIIFLYFIFNSIVGFIYGMSSMLVPLYSFWFLIALAVWRLTAPYISEIKGIMIFLLAASVVAGFYISLDNTLAVSRIICFFPWYMTGYFFSKEKSDKLISRKYTKRLASGTVMLLVTAVLFFVSKYYFRYSDNELLMLPYSKPSEALGRCVLYIAALSAIITLLMLMPDKKLPLLTMFGRNSLWIFILHRPLTLILSDIIIDLPVYIIISVAVIAAVLMCILLGNNLLAKVMDAFADQGVRLICKDNNNKSNKKKINYAGAAVLIVSFCFILNALTQAYTGKDLIRLVYPKSSSSPKESIEEIVRVPENNIDEDIIYPVMSAQQKKAFDSSFRITFAGDLILLEDQVKRAYNGKGYDFSEVFEYAEPYISSADLAVGVFEGPMAGEEAGYSTSNYDDGKELYINYPDEFADAVKKAGFDLVTTANNHLLDKGEKGALRTIDILDKSGLDHTGSYKNAEDKKKNRIKIVECQGIRLAFLSYTYGCNYYTPEKLSDSALSYLTSLISETEGELFEAQKAAVEQDFKEAKSCSPDLIVVLPHIGTQFSNEPDHSQNVWFDIFKKNGADIILGDHPHVVEPVLIEEYNGKNVFTAYCPGNFANIYREDQGDTSMLVDVYIDRDTKKITGGSIVPLYTHARADHNYRAVPIYDIMTDASLRDQLTTDDIQLAANANKLITKVVFGHEMDISSAAERYYFDSTGFLRCETEGLMLTDKMKSGILYKAISKAQSICFIGDSVTEGTKNGGCPWYEPILDYIPEKKVSNYSKGGCTVSYMTGLADKIPVSDLYVIALGTNDVRYRDSSVCAMTPDDFVREIDALKNKLSSHSQKAEFVFIAPWYSTDGDIYCDMSYNEKTDLNDEYSSALEKYCKEKSLGFINANNYIKNVLKTSPDNIYLLDHIHPNASKGVVMYSEAVLSSNKK